MNILLFALLFTVFGTNISNAQKGEWDTWKQQNSKVYNSELEETLRMKIYMENRAKVDRHNRLASTGQHHYHLKINKYGDLLLKEYISLLNGYRRDNSNRTNEYPGATFLRSAHCQQVPQEMDWRTMGAVNPVRDQGDCGSCWSFSALGALEAMHFRKTGKLVNLSEQNLIDCSRVVGNNGCKGGQMNNAFQYIRENDGIDTESSYPYEGHEHVCRYNPRHKGASVLGFVNILNEEDLEHAVASVGPVSAAIDSSHGSFQFYSHGVYTEKHCSSSQLDHAVLIVGYGVEPHSGRKYWLVKNSWGTNWGEDGYVKIARRENNMCGIATQASYPLV